MTIWPSASNRWQRCEPMKPAPPETSTRLRARSRLASAGLAMRSPIGRAAEGDPAKIPPESLEPQHHAHEDVSPHLAEDVVAPHGVGAQDSDASKRAAEAHDEHGK